MFGLQELPRKTGPAEVAKGGSFGHTADSVKLQSTCSEFGVKLWGFRAVRDFLDKIPSPCHFPKDWTWRSFMEGQIIQLQSTNKEVLDNYLYLKRC